MKIVKLQKRSDLMDAVEFVVKVLKKGGIVVHPTDTCYGLAADITNQKAVEKIYTLKKRDRGKPVNIIVSDEEQFRIYGHWHEIINSIKNENKSRMCSFVVQKTDKVPAHLNPKFDNIGMQIPRHAFSKRLLKKTQVPLVATSANLSGQPNLYSINELLLQMEGEGLKPDMIVDAGTLPDHKVSMVIEIKSDCDYKILRD